MSEPTLDRRRVLRAGVVAAAALVVGEGRGAGAVARTAPAAPPPLSVPGDLRALTPWRGRWCALVTASDTGNALFATTPDLSRWGTSAT
jgi:hypothetical protein